jgi:hypothetical protein
MHERTRSELAAMEVAPMEAGELRALRLERTGDGGEVSRCGASTAKAAALAATASASPPCADLTQEMKKKRERREEEESGKGKNVISPLCSLLNN